MTVAGWGEAVLCGWGAGSRAILVLCVAVPGASGWAGAQGTAWTGRGVPGHRARFGPCWSRDRRCRRTASRGDVPAGPPGSEQPGHSLASDL